MSITRSILMHAFGRPRGVLGRLGGIIMARTNKRCGAWVTGLVDGRANDNVVEVGFGPGVVIERLAKLAPKGRIAGIDPSAVMVAQARARNASTIESGRVDLRRGSAESPPFANDSFDKAVAINSMQVWPDALSGLREMRRVIKPGGRIALGFTHYSGQPKLGVTQTLAAAGFTEAHLVEQEESFCALAIKP